MLAGFVLQQHLGAHETKTRGEQSGVALEGLEVFGTFEFDGV